MAGKAAREGVIVPFLHDQMPASEEGSLISHTKRRISIKVVFTNCYGRVEPDLWEQFDVVPGIMARLGIPRGSRASVVKTLNDIVEAQSRDDKYDPSHSLSSRGRRPKIEWNSTEMALIIQCQATEISVTQTAIVVNEFRACLCPPLKPVSWGTVANFIRTCGCINKDKRAYQKSGSKNPDTEWSKARKALCQQLLDQLSLGLNEDQLCAVGVRNNADLADTIDASSLLLPAIKLHAIVWWDEHHKECILGPTSKYEVRTSVDEV